MSAIKCFFVQRINRFQAVLNRYGEISGDAACLKRKSEAPFDMHEGNTALDESHERPAFPDDDDPRWPTRCDYCEGIFNAATSNRSMTTQHFYRDPLSEQIYKTPLPVGAMFFAEPGESYCKGFDGRTLVVMIPDTRCKSGAFGWHVDSQASNCPEPCETCGVPYNQHWQRYAESEFKCRYVPRDKGAHRCWCRHGEPPLVTVNKSGPTCSAGAGSIISPSGWHGFLRNGELVPC
jgi:hypothetical protein